MERLVNFRSDQHVTTDDLTNIETYAQKTFSDVFSDAVDPGQKYSGMLVTQNGPTGITVAGGRFYSGGQAYFIDTSTNLSLTTGLPVVAQKIATVVVWGIQQQANVQPRAFIINADTGQFQPQTVAMETDFIVQMAIVYGTESAAPFRGPIASGVIAIADVLLSPAGVISISMDPSTALGAIVDIDLDLQALKAWQLSVTNAINTLKTDMSLLKQSIPPDLSSVVKAIANQITIIMNFINKPATAVYNGVNRFINLNDTDITKAGYAASVQDGLRFPAGSSLKSPITLLNPTDPRVITIGNVTLPAFQSVTRHQHLPPPLPNVLVQTVTYSESEYLVWWYGWWPIDITSVTWSTVVIIPNIVTFMFIAQFPSVSVFWKRRHIRRFCVRYGDWWNTSVANPTGTLIEYYGATNVTNDIAEQNRRPDLKFYTCQRAGGEIYTLDLPSFWQLGDPAHLVSRRAQGCFLDYYDDPYWDAVYETGSNSGATMAHAFLNQSNGWMTHLHIWPQTLGGTGDINIWVVEVDGSYAPDMTKVISHMVAPIGNLVGGNHGSMIPIVPCFLQGGTTYAIVMQTAGNHAFYSAAAAQQAQANFQESVLWYLNAAGNWIAPAAQTPMFFEVYMAQFLSTRQEVQMNPGQLVGGIGAARVLSAGYAPPGTSLTWEAQVAGVWIPLDADDAGAFNALPPLVPIQAVFTGTSAVMPAIDLTQTELELTTMGTSMDYFSAGRTLGSPTVTVTLDATIQGYDPAHHTVGAKVHVGATTYNPTTGPTDTPDAQDPTLIYRHWSFTISSSSTFYYEITGTTVFGFKYPVVKAVYDHAF